MKLKLLSIFIAFSLLPCSLVFAKKIPSATLTADNLFFSPNKDGIQDEIIFRIKTEKLKSITSWHIKIKDSAGVLRKTVSGSQNIPESVSWDGEDDSGALCAEGNYEVNLELLNEKNKQVVAPPLKVVLDLTPPTISLNAFVKTIPIKESILPPVTFYFSAVDLSGIVNWKLQLADQKKQEFFSELSSAPIPSSWVFPGGKVDVLPEKIIAILSVTDQAGNRAESPPIDIKIEKSSLSTQKTVRSPFLQMTVILSISDLFGNGADGKSQLLPHAAVLLNPLVKAISDTTGTRTTILGHVDLHQNSQESKVLSSYFAWKIFSYFVKDKGIDKSLISVRGFGAEVPIADNRTLLGRARNRRIEIQIFYPAVVE